MRKVAVLGSTGSIGTQTLDVAREQGDIEVVALSCEAITAPLTEMLSDAAEVAAAVKVTEVLPSLITYPSMSAVRLT